ncbi:molybdopterin-binding protein [Cuniculiplasma sp. SKW4]|uniref:molybdopterin-binding protein n=1 Tax=Cuniculiplasma sp. SKW4 TaxID=3400171 RepID=UPI003FD149BF
MKFGILTVGNEVVKGRTVNTNASEISRSLIENGHEVVYVVTCRDEPGDICKSLKFLMENCDSIVSSGGLGPTIDDITIQSIAKCLNLKMEVNEEAIKILADKYSSLNLTMTEERKKMAMMPEGASIIKNDVGTAPGMVLNYEGRFVFSIPGVPKEMRQMLKEIIKITGRGKLNYISREIKIEGIMESSFAPYIRKISEETGKGVFVKSHPESMEFSNPILIIEVYGYSENEKELEETVNRCLKEINNYAIKLNGRIKE